MEEIIIKEIVRKDSGLAVVKYNGNRTATIAKWQAQEADYIENDVGIGGRVKVLIEVKGDYTNITKVDFESAVKNSGSMETPQETTGLMSVKDIQIISQCLTKAWAQTDKDPKEILDAYRFFVKSLEEEG